MKSPILRKLPLYCHSFRLVQFMVFKCDLFELPKYRDINRRISVSCPTRFPWSLLAALPATNHWQSQAASGFWPWPTSAKKWHFRAKNAQLTHCSLCPVSCILQPASCILWAAHTHAMWGVAVEAAEKKMRKELTEAPFDYGIFGSLFRPLFTPQTAGNAIMWMSWGAVGVGWLVAGVRVCCVCSGQGATGATPMNVPEHRPKRIKAICVQSAQLSFQLSPPTPQLVASLNTSLVLRFFAALFFWLFSFFRVDF